MESTENRFSFRDDKKLKVSYNVKHMKIEYEKKMNKLINSEGYDVPAHIRLVNNCTFRKKVYRDKFIKHASMANHLEAIVFCIETDNFLCNNNYGFNKYLLQIIKDKRK